MSDPKLFVIQKNFFKFVKTTLLKGARDRVPNGSNKDKKNVRQRIIFYNQQRVKKTYNPFKRKERPFERVFGALFRSLDIDTRLRQLEFATFWKSLAPYAAKDHRELRTVWLKPSNDVPRLSRGFKAKSDSKPSEAQKVKSKQRTEKSSEKSRAVERVSGQFDGTIEQRYYTGEITKETFRALPKNEQENELPPPLRCRLSCPLPPVEFIPVEEKQFFPTYQSAPVRFSSLPEEFLPPPKEPSSAPESESISLKTREHSYAKKINSPACASESVDLPDFLPKIRNKKTYMNLKRIESQLQNSREVRREEVPKMKALLFEPNSLELNFDAVNVPTKIHKDEVLVQVIYSGVCGTDLFITEGKVSCGVDPVILGHEISGRVYAVGSEVNHVVPGDHIAVNAYTACCFCRYCSRGLYSACENDGLNNSIGISKNGGWAEYVVVKKSQVYKIPEELGLDQAVLIQPLSCVLSALSKLNITHGMDILIQGLGLSGCLWASVLHSKGIRNVLVSDKSPKRKEQFESLNLNYTFVPPEDIGKLAVDVIIECTGSPTFIEKAFNILNPNGKMCFFGKPNPMTEVRCIPYEIINKEITIVGIAGNAFCFSNAIDLARSMGDQYLDFDKLGVQVFDLEDYREAFQLKKLGEVGKILFKFDN